jgi:ABC-type branched-subunit amino acid transport system substrate-binding protein
MASAKVIKATGQDHRRNHTREERSDMRNGIFHLVTGTAVAIALSASSAQAQKKYDTGATDTEIKIGQTVPFSGPASAYATIGKAQAAYVR